MAGTLASVVLETYGGHEEISRLSVTIVAGTLAKLCIGISYCFGGNGNSREGHYYEVLILGGLRMQLATVECRLLVGNY